MRLTVNIAAPVAGTTEWTIARSSRFSLRIPQLVAPATKPLAAVTLDAPPGDAFELPGRERQAMQGRRERP
jgi:hypothetical protein